MFASVVAALWLALVAAPADGLGLEPIPSPGGPASPPAPVVPSIPLGIAIGAGGAAALAVRRPRPRGRNGRSEAPLYVLVPGHGGTAADFDRLVELMGVSDDSIEAFDYRWAYPSGSEREAAMRAPASDAADALSTFVNILARDHANIYVIGHSKGGAVVTELIGRWDTQPAAAVSAVRGAALLDPAIATGPLGELQRVGFAVDGLADNGRFDPIRCGIFTCHDVRAGLGDAAGVEVIAVRNRDALVTNFSDRPDGLRVYDLDDGGIHPLARPWDPAAVLTRIGEAHGSVLRSRTVADCILAESASPGSCTWPGEIVGRGGSGRSGGGPLVM